MFVYKTKEYLERIISCMVPGGGEESWANKPNYTFQ
jgi:hypothetical protein